MSIAEERLALVMGLGFEATGIYLMSDDWVATQVRESEAGKIITWMLRNTELKPSALEVEMALGINGDSMARNCCGVVTECHVCHAKVWPWSLKRYDEEADACINLHCGKKHGRYACDRCFITASRRVQARELRNATRREARRAALNRVPMEVSGAEVAAMEV
jgi:hypothetical protein